MRRSHAGGRAPCLGYAGSHHNHQPQEGAHGREPHATAVRRAARRERASICCHGCGDCGRNWSSVRPGPASRPSKGASRSIPSHTGHAAIHRAARRRGAAGLGSSCRMPHLLLGGPRARHVDAGPAVGVRPGGVGDADPAHARADLLARDFPLGGSLDRRASVRWNAPRPPFRDRRRPASDHSGHGGGPTQTGNDVAHARIIGAPIVFRKPCLSGF